MPTSTAPGSPVSVSCRVRKPVSKDSLFIQLCFDTSTRAAQIWPHLFKLASVGRHVSTSIVLLED